MKIDNPTQFESALSECVIRRVKTATTTWIWWVLIRLILLLLFFLLLFFFAAATTSLFLCCVVFVFLYYSVHLYDGNGDDRTGKTAAKQPIRWWYVLSYLYIGETERTLANERTNVTQSLSQCVEKCVKKQRISFVCVCSSQLVAQTTPEQNDLKIFESFTERFYSHIFGVLQQLERGTHKFSIEGELTRCFVIALLCFDCNVSTCAILYRNRVFHVSPAKWRRFRVYILLL